MMILIAMKRFWCFAVFWISVDALSAQIIYTSTFTKTLETAGITYIEPLEQWLHVTIPPDHDYMRYDLVLQNDRNDFEVRYHVYSGRNAQKSVPPFVEVSRLVSSIASNNELHEIRVTIPPDDLLQEVFNADRGVIAYFTPKEEFSEKPYGALLSLYAGEHRGIAVVLLYSNMEFDPITAYRSIYFRELGIDK
jgi:hypothetical protein